jgi:hypothetical protein
LWSIADSKLRGGDIVESDRLLFFEDNHLLVGNADANGVDAVLVRAGGKGARDQGKGEQAKFHAADRTKNAPFRDIRSAFALNPEPPVGRTHR